MENLLAIINNDPKVAVGLAGIVPGVLLYFTPMKIILRVVEERSSEKLSLTPYLLAYMNCMFCMVYAYWSLNLLAVIANAIYCGIIIHYIMILMFLSPKNVILDKRIGELVVLTVAVLTSTFVPFSMPENISPLFTGSLATALSMVLYTLSLVSVIETKDVEFMSFYSSTLMFLNGAFWFAFAVLRQDHFMIWEQYKCTSCIQITKTRPRIKTKKEELIHPTRSSK
ncbi:hypothetical protein ACP275_03G009500 [Erythranthe tilingii]